MKTKKTQLAATLYFALSFFVFGAAAMIHFFIYPTFYTVHEQLSAFMELFNGRIIFVLYTPLVLLFLTSISLFWAAPKRFPKWAAGVSVLLSGIAAIATLFLLNPIQHSFLPTGFTETQYHNLLSYSLSYQLIPLALQALLALLLAINFLPKIKGKWIVIALFILAFYTAGTDFVEKLINYPLWRYVSNKEWSLFRLAAKSIALVWVYLIPAFLPLLFLLLMFWFKPALIKKKTVWLYLGLYLLIVISTFTYFVPKLQIPLDQTYSAPLIEQLIKTDLPLRFLPGLITYALATFLFLKVARYNREDVAGR